jgi:hypothetical protein
MLHAGTRHDLSQVKQKENGNLRSYSRHFFKKRTTITNTTDEDVIHCFKNSLGSKNIYRDFGCNRPKTIMELRDMMQGWANQEDNDKSNNDSRSNKR